MGCGGYYMAGFQDGWACAQNCMDGSCTWNNCDDCCDDYGQGMDAGIYEGRYHAGCGCGGCGGGSCY